MGSLLDMVWLLLFIEHLRIAVKSKMEDPKPKMTVHNQLA